MGDDYSNLAAASISTIGTLGAQLMAGYDSEQGRIFAEQENQKARNWSAWQNDLAREFALDTYQRFQSPEAMVRQYKEAGLNPALMYDKSPSGGASFSAPSVSGAATAGLNRPTIAQSFNNVLGALSNIASVAGQISQIHVKKENLQSQTKLNFSKVEEVSANCDHLRKLIESEDYKQSLYASEVTANEAKASVDFMEAVLLRMDAETREEYNHLQNLYVESQIKLTDKKSELTDEQKKNLRTQSRLYESEMANLAVETIKAQKESELIDIKKGTERRTQSLILEQMMSIHREGSYKVAKTKTEDALRDSWKANIDAQSGMFKRSPVKNTSHSEGNYIWTRSDSSGHYAND